MNSNTSNNVKDSTKSISDISLSSESNTFINTATELYQYGTVTSLMKGIFHGTETIDNIKKHGNIGLGCGTGLGELIIVDGKFYLADETGSINILKNQSMAAYASVVNFIPHRKFKIKDINDLSKLEQKLDKNITSNNIFHVFKISGFFNRIDGKSEKIATPPYEPLDKWLQKYHRSFISENCNAILTIIKSPLFTKGIGVPGYHTHYITADKKTGGHVFNVDIQNAEVELMSVYKMNLELPQNQEYLDTNLEYTDKNHAFLEKIEKASIKEKKRTL